MKAVTILYMVNALLLLLHEIESGYEREWELLKLPGKLTGFLLFHIPIILVIFIGLLEINGQTRLGAILGIITGIGGCMPFLVHKLMVKGKEHFNSPISNIIIYLNALAGVATALWSAAA